MSLTGAYNVLNACLPVMLHSSAYALRSRAYVLRSSAYGYALALTFLYRCTECTMEKKRKQSTLGAFLKKKAKQIEVSAACLETELEKNDNTG